LGRMNLQKYKSYGIMHSFSRRKGEPLETWTINGNGTRGFVSVSDKPVFTYVVPSGTPDSERWGDEPPAPIRAEYERLIEYAPGDPIPSPFNIVELAASTEDDPDVAYDQPCQFGNRVETHAVYCHCNTWLYSPRKCRRNRTDFKHENCPGYIANPKLGTANALTEIPPTHAGGKA
jgi:hypothetical protein